MVFSLTGSRTSSKVIPLISAILWAVNIAMPGLLHLLCLSAICVGTKYGASVSNKSLSKGTSNASSWIFLALEKVANAVIPMNRFGNCWHNFVANSLDPVKQCIWIFQSEGTQFWRIAIVSVSASRQWTTKGFPSVTAQLACLVKTCFWISGGDAECDE